MIPERKDHMETVRERYSRDELSKMDDIHLVAVAKRYSPIISSESSRLAREVLWERWKPFTNKTYMRGRTLHERVGLSIEDYMQDAYLYFEKAVEQFSLEKARLHHLTSWSTWYYRYLLNLYNRSQSEFEKYSDPVYISQFDESDDEDQSTYLSRKFEQATSYDPSSPATEKENLAHKIVDEYRKTITDPDMLDILDFMLSGMTSKGISTHTGIEIAQCRRVMSHITQDLKRYASSLGWDE